MNNKIFLSLPMALVVVRGLIGPVLLILGLVGISQIWFVTLFSIAFLTDVFDGPLARKLGIASSFGALADSCADIILYASAIITICITHTGDLRVCFPLMSVVLALELVSWTLSLLKFGRITSYHSLIAKVLAPVLFLGILSIVIFRFVELFTVALLMWVVINLEGIIMTLVLKNYATDVRSISHAVKHRSRSDAKSTLIR